MQMRLQVVLEPIKHSCFLVLRLNVLLQCIVIAVLVLHFHTHCEDSGRMGASVQVFERKWLKLRTVGCFAFRPRRCWQRTSSRGVQTYIFFRAVTCDVYIFVCCIYVRLPLCVSVLAWVVVRVCVWLHMSSHATLTNTQKRSTEAIQQQLRALSEFSPLLLSGSYTRVLSLSLSLSLSHTHTNIRKTCSLRICRFRFLWRILYHFPSYCPHVRARKHAYHTLNYSIHLHVLPADFMPNSSSTRFYKRDTKDECPDMLAAPVTLTPTHTREHARTHDTRTTHAHTEPGVLW